MDLNRALEELKDLYTQCPEVECRQCGACCVSPHMTFVEFAYLLQTLLEHSTREELCELVAAEPQLSPTSEGNLACALQGDKLCLAREGRTLSCRLEGLAAVDRLFKRTNPPCTNAREKSTDVDESHIEAYLNKLNELNEEFQQGAEEPWHLDGLNLECWLAVALDPKIRTGLFGELKARLRCRFDLTFLDQCYKDHTRLAEKLEAIEKFWEAANAGNGKDAHELLMWIRDGFPRTGSYFFWHAKAYLEMIEGEE